MNRVLFLALVASAAAAGYFVVDPPVNLQAASPGTQQTGNTNISGTMLAGKVSAANAGATAQVVVGDATSTTGANFGGLFKTASSSGTAVRGVASAASGATNGGTFQAAAPSGAGARGFHTATTGAGFGLFGQTASSEGKGVSGVSTAASGGVGVHGAAGSFGLAALFEGRSAILGSLGIGTTSPFRPLHVMASATGSGSNFTSDAVVVERNGGGGVAVLGGASNQLYLRFQTGSSNNGGLYANPSAVPGGLSLATGNAIARVAITSGGNVGIGTTSPSSLLDVSGDLKATNLSGAGAGLTALNASNIGSGTLSDARLSTNVARRNLSNLFLGSQEFRSTSTFFRLVHGTTLNSLVRGGDRGGFGGFLYVQDPNGTTQVGMEVLAANAGNIFADTKNFRVPNPEDPKTDIWYACVEGPEAAAYLRGTARLENGRAFVQFPQHFKSVAVSKGMTVQLTARSVDTYGLAVLESTIDGISVGELQRGKGSFEFDWEVKAVRKGHEDYKVIRPWDNIVTADEDKQEAWANRLKSIEDRKNRDRANEPPTRLKRG
jgi:hypothetical protein